MGLTNLQKELIRSIADNDMQKAKKYAVSCLNEDTTAKNEMFCKSYRTRLTTTGNNMIELPPNVVGLLTMEDVTTSFNENRYYLSDREKNLYDTIIKMKDTNDRLEQLGIQYPNTTLLFGSSGTGKTMFGRYVAHKTGLPFVYLNFSNLVDSYMGSTSKNISKAFDFANQNNCVFMLDEIDCISIRRESGTGSSGGTGGELARITITLMQEFDKITNGHIIIAATNRKDRIDEALLRRLTTRHEFKVFSVDEKVAMIKKYLDDIQFQYDNDNIYKFCKDNESMSQADTINYVIKCIVESINENKQIEL